MKPPGSPMATVGSMPMASAVGRPFSAERRAAVGERWRERHARIADGLVERGHALRTSELTMVAAAAAYREHQQATRAYHASLPLEKRLEGGDWFTLSLRHNFERRVDVGRCGGLATGLSSKQRLPEPKPLPPDFEPPRSRSHQKARPFTAPVAQPQRTRRLSWLNSAGQRPDSAYSPQHSSLLDQPLSAPLLESTCSDTAAAISAESPSAPEPMLCCALEPSVLVIEQKLGESQTGKFQVTNSGNVAAYIHWNCRPRGVREGEGGATFSSRFYCAVDRADKAALLPGETRVLEVHFVPPSTGAFIEEWTLRTLPPYVGEAPKLVLRGYCVPRPSLRDTCSTLSAPHRAPPCGSPPSPRPSDLSSFSESQSATCRSRRHPLRAPASQANDSSSNA